eukprot:COSAG02_NODE_25189_length_666_cov_1.042328_1_plen_160_part_01
MERLTSSGAVTSMTQLTSLDLSGMRQLGLDAVDRYLLDMIRQEAIENGVEEPAATIRRLQKRLREKEKEVRELERQLRQPNTRIMQAQRHENAWEAEQDGGDDDDGRFDDEEQEDIYVQETRQSTKRAKERKKRSKQKDRAPGPASVPEPEPEPELELQP